MTYVHTYISLSFGCERTARSTGRKGQKEYVYERDQDQTQNRSDFPYEYICIYIYTCINM